MAILTVDGLCKRYEKFHLKDVSFRLKKGYIMGFIGSNGAGKTTTLKSMLGLVRTDSGTVTVMGQDFFQNELKLKPQIGFMFGGVDYYAKSPLGKITGVIKRFYPRWDDDVCARYMHRFGLDETKKLGALSSGMKTKFALTLALSHHARLFILDEPTSGLDPVARDDLLELFQELIEDGEKSILFSTHITSDLEKCADYVTYIENGRLVASETKDDLIAGYRVVKGAAAAMGGIAPRLIAYKTNAFGFTGLIRTEDLGTDDVTAEPPSLEEIMIYHAKKEAVHEESAV